MRLKMLPPRAQLTLPDGSVVEVERIGRGRYSTAWRNCGNVYTQTSEKDSGKELLSRLDDNPHLPKVEQLEWTDGNAPYRWYRMPLYQPLTAKSGQAWEDFKVLKQLREDSWRKTDHGGYGRNITADEDAYKFNAIFRETVEASSLPQPLKEAVNQLLDECCNYGAYIIEISKRNCAVDDAGNLILLDPVFDLAEVRGKRQ